MRCPNCGNENPDDYTFCDECGAKLTADTGDVAAAAPTGVDGAAAPSPMPAPAASSGGEAAPAEMAAADATNAAPATMTASTTTSAAVCPNCGAPTVPGEAFCNECGAELSTLTASSETPPAPAADASAAPAAQESSAPSAMEPYMGATPGEGQPDATAAGMPVTEDTMIPTAASTAEATAAEATPMPGVMPVSEAAPAEPAAIPAPAMPDMAAAIATATPMAGGSTAAWATETLRQLEEGQAAMAKGDWVTYGQSMGALKSYLENVVKGTAPEVTGMDVTAPPAMPASPTATEATPDMAAMTTPTPAAAPAADTGAGSGMARLVVIATGAEMPLPQQEEITVGREDPSSGIFPDIDLTPYGGEDGGVSRRHARLLHIGGDYFVEDLQSTNYTKLDGQRLPARVREKLEDGARLDFGRVAMIFRKG